MPSKNSTTKVPANRSIEEIQTALVNHGATGVLYEYEQGTGRIDALLEWRRFQAVLKAEHVSRWDDEDYVYRGAWRCIRDLILAQLALYETRLAELPQVFLPFATGKGGKTLYKQVQSGQFFLGDGK
jgi:hypothetical protein